MSFIDFESGSAKERARQELREARAELLSQAEKRFNQRQVQAAKKTLRGEDNWILPSVERKLERTDKELTSTSTSTSKKSKKSKKEKKSKKSKKEKSKTKKRKKHSSSSESGDGSSTSDSDDDAETDRRRNKKRKQKSRKQRSRSNSSSSNSASEADEWVEIGSTTTTKSASKPGPVQRDDWMSGIQIPTFSKPVQEKKKDDRQTIDSYDPAKSSRELNPFWKNGGGGLPSAAASSAASFRKPRNDSDDDEADRRSHKRAAQSSASSSSTAFRGNWRKSKPTSEVEPQNKRDRSASPGDRGSRSTHRSRQSRSPQQTAHHPSSRHSSSGNSTDNSGKLSRSRSPSPLTVSERPAPPLCTAKDTAQPAVARPRTADFLTDQQMNDLGAKVMRAEIMGNAEQATALRAKLAAARDHRNAHKVALVAAAKAATKAAGHQQHTATESEDVLLTATNSRGFSKPLQRQASTAPADPWGGRSGGRGGKKKQPKKVDTHEAGERVRYFADDDKYDIKQMFENEKFTSGHDQDAQFVDIAGRHKNPNDDLEDIFAERAAQRGTGSAAQLDERERAAAIRQHQQMAKTLDSCDRCFGTAKMEKQLLVAMGTAVYLALPWYEGLLPGHCQIVPVQHATCATELDEDVWTEVVDFQKAVTRMFRARGQDCIFFETARYLHKRPHMVVNCVPSKDFEMAPFYFKKAIQESEREWSTNKQLVTLRERDLRRSIPRGLPYFWVHFGVDSGFAHVIEEQERFPANFATEIIGGMLEMDARKWRHHRKEQNSIARVRQVAEWWKPFDITNSE